MPEIEVNTPWARSTDLRESLQQILVSLLKVVPAKKAYLATRSEDVFNVSATYELPISFKNSELYVYELAALEKIIDDKQAKMGDQAELKELFIDQLPNNVYPKKRILLDDGNLELEVIEKDEKNIKTKVVIGGLLKSKKGINLPGEKINIPAFTEKDEKDLEFGLKLGVDAVAISFVCSADDIAQVRRAINHYSPNEKKTSVIAKLERPEALDNLHDIIEVADGVMVARGDLGIEMAPEQLPIAQKQIIEEANNRGKIVITATQMLDSMINNPRPTRAESSDVANAIFDGTDAVMLSGETAVGKYPIEALRMMEAIIQQTEGHYNEWGHWKGRRSEISADDAIHITQAARELAHDLNVAAIVVFTQSGRTAKLMSKALPRVPILGFTPIEETYRQMVFYWGVTPYLVPQEGDFDKMLSDVDTAMIESTYIKPGQQVVVISGYPVKAMRPPNLALLYTVGQNNL